MFDGHGGQEVAKFASKYMVPEFQKIASEKRGDLEAALPVAFHRIDSLLRDPKNAGEIRGMSRDAGGSSTAAGGPAAAGSGGGGGGGAGKNAADVRSSIDSSLDEARKKGKLSQKEAMELMLKMMALQVWCVCVCVHASVVWRVCVCVS